MTSDCTVAGGTMYPFQDGKVPPILENRKRNRRISSIVGVPSQS